MGPTGLSRDSAASSYQVRPASRNKEATSPNQGTEPLKLWVSLLATYATFCQRIKLPVFDANGDPVHHRGVDQTEPGLYFLGLPFQSSLLSGVVGGVGADAQYIVTQIARRARAAAPAHAGRRTGKQPMITKAERNS